MQTSSLPKLVALAALLTGSLHQAASAHGLYGHVHVTGWAIDSLPAGELRSLFADPELRRAALMGAVFPDTGYTPLPEADRRRGRAYSARAHKEPFVQRFVERLRSEYAPPYDTREEKLLIAFLLGVASHGLQDELFDSTLLCECEQRDGAGQAEADPGTDGFLVADGYAWMLPGDFVPWDVLLALFAEVPEGIDRSLMERGVGLVKVGYLNDGVGRGVARLMDERHRAAMPWTARHYLDPAVPGSLRAEIAPTASYMQAIWERLHGRAREADLVIHTWPDLPRRLREGRAESAASWVTLVLGRGLIEGSASGAFHAEEGGEEQPFRLAGTRWGGTSRILRFQPTTDLLPGSYYRVRLDPGARLVDGTTTTLAHELRFQVACDDAELCPPVVVVDPDITPRPRSSGQGQDPAPERGGQD